MKKRFLCLIMAVFLIVLTPLNVFAEDYKSSKDWKVAFNGNKMETNFSGTDVAEELLNNIQPGDSFTVKIRLEENSGKASDWYMKNDIISTLEDGSVANGGAYTYLLSYTDPSGASTEIYNSDTVGGESFNQGKEGLHEVSNGLDTYIYLDRLENGKSAYVSLYVKLDGETQGNDYQKTLAKLQLNFAVEKVADEVIEKHTVQKKHETREIVTYSTQMVKTGDQSQVVLFSVITLLSGLALGILAFILLKKRGHKREE